MHRPLRSWLAQLSAATALFALLGLGACAPRPQALPAPKAILFIVLDCLRADHLGPYGAHFPASPHLDELAAGGVVFEHAESQASWTRPSLPSLLTGLYPSEHGLTDPFEAGAGKRFKVLSDEAETLAEGLASKGYRTALLGDQVQLSRTFHTDQGFQEFRNKLGRASNIRKRFESWMGEGKGQPFFAYLHFLDLHWPYCVRDSFGKFDATPGSRNFCGEGWRNFGDKIATGETKLSPADLVALKARYAEQLLDLDVELGKLFEAMKAAGNWDESLIIVTADHGEELFDHDGFRHGHTLYEELLHVPFVWKLPKSWGAPGGTKVAGLTETRSLTPTLFAATGVPLSKRVTAPSLLPWLLGKETARAPAEVTFAESNGMYSVRDLHFKMIVDTNKKTRLLFDLEHDPGETTDLASSDPKDLEAMEQKLRAWRSALQPLPRGAGAEIDDAQVEELRALGYIQ